MIGRVLGAKYELLDKLGEGGMGTVYLARRIHIGDEVAIKVLHPQFVRDKDAVARFRREARAAALIQHPNVVAIYDYGEEPGDDAPAFIVMELVRGQTLRQMLRREGKLDPARAVALMREICAGVGAGHRRQVVHRDLKPDNVIVLAPDSESDGEEARERVKVVDFGIAKLRDLAADLTLTETGVVLGTPYYMSPEQCRGETLDARSDVYSLGAVLYEMLSGAPPFTGATATAVVAKQLTAIPRPLAAFAQIPNALEALVFRALAKEPPDRPADAGALARALGAALTPPEARVVPLQAVALDPPPHTAAQNEATAEVPSRLPAAGPLPTVRTPDFKVTRAARSGRAQVAIGLGLLAAVLLGGAALWMSNSHRPQQAAALPAQVALPSPPSAQGPTPDPALPTPSPEPTPTPEAGENAVVAPGASFEDNEALIVRGDPVTPGGLAGLSPDDLRLLRHATSARHGRAFDSPELQSHFASRPWYQRRADFSEEALTPTDRENLALIRAAEAAASAASMRASSTRSPADVFGPAAARDGRLDTAWRAGASGPGLGEWVEFTFSPREIRFIDVFPGNGQSREMFEADHRLKRATLLFSDGTKVQGLFFDDMRTQTVALSRPVRARSLKLIIEEVYAGARGHDTPISEIHWR